MDAESKPKCSNHPTDSVMPELSDPRLWLKMANHSGDFECFNESSRDGFFKWSVEGEEQKGETESNSGKKTANSLFQNVKNNAFNDKKIKSGLELVSPNPTKKERQNKKSAFRSQFGYKRKTAEKWQTNKNGDVMLQLW